MCHSLHNASQEEGADWRAWWLNRSCDVPNGGRTLSDEQCCRISTSSSAKHRRSTVPFFYIFSLNSSGHCDAFDEDIRRVGASSCMVCLIYGPRRWFRELPATFSLIAGFLRQDPALLSFADVDCCPSQLLRSPSKYRPAASREIAFSDWMAKLSGGAASCWCFR